MWSSWCFNLCKSFFLSFPYINYLNDVLFTWRVLHHPLLVACLFLSSKLMWSCILPFFLFGFMAHYIPSSVCSFEHACWQFSMLVSFASDIWMFFNIVILCLPGLEIPRDRRKIRFCCWRILYRCSNINWAKTSKCFTCGQYEWIFKVKVGCSAFEMHLSILILSTHIINFPLNKLYSCWIW